MPKTEPGDIRPLLERLGRASTPAVNTTAYNINLAEIAGYDVVSPGPAGETAGPIAFVGSAALRERLLGMHPILAVSPGMAAHVLEQVSLHSVVIDMAALHGGPWCGAADAAASHLMEELVFLALENRRHGRLTYLVRHGGVRMPGTKGLEREASLVVTGTLSDPATEGSPPSRLLSALIDYAAIGEMP
ncbi:hypothetical protein [Arthrobacter sp. KK5.5]|uniref:hypothetical protein n=1 Tax=Arthrobacter sp. KK5.5 TaxID=3373084 RepID=UPI003EE43FB0